MNGYPRFQQQKIANLVKAALNDELPLSIKAQLFGRIFLSSIWSLKNFMHGRKHQTFSGTFHSNSAPSPNRINTASNPMRGEPVNTPTQPTSSGPNIAANLPSML